MKINNEYINTKEYTENFFVEGVTVSEEKDKVFDKGLECVTLGKGEDYESMDGYNKFGSHIDDYERMQKWGLAPADEEDVAVTVYERIQIQLMTYCEDYNGTGMSIDKAKMAKVLGSSSMAEATSKAESIQKFNDNTKEYMLKNNMEPTVDNMYMAVHSSGQKEVASITDPAMQAAVKDKLVKEGYQITDENVAKGMWLVERDIELTSKNMNKLSELNQIDALVAGDELAVETLTRNIAFSIYSGKSAGGAYITDRYVNTQDVKEVVDAVNAATDEDIAYISVNSMMLNVQSLKLAKEADKSYITDADKNSVKSVTFRQTIFEARIVMTQSSVYNLKKLGVDINYTEISQMTEDIVANRNQLVNMMLEEEDLTASAEEKSLLMNTFNAMSAFSGLPNAVVGKVYSQEISFTMTEIQVSGVQLKNQYEAAMMTYETLGTEVRRDLGDSYSKAFSNVDSLLQGIGMEVNGVNQRAVRILGYNSMEISVESVTGVRELAAELDYLMNNLNPKTAMHLIKHGINPLEDNIKDVNAMLENINEEIGTSDEKMGKFLWNLEKKGEVTAKEKEDYIELFRILNMISKNDGNVIGRVISEGRECTLKNLYSAYKSKKSGNFDYSLSDDYNVTYVKRSLTTFMEKEADITDLMENGQIKDFSLEKMLEMAAESEETDYSYYEEQMKRYEGVTRLTATEIENLTRQLQTSSISEIAAYMNISNAKNFMKKITDYKNIDEAIANIEEVVDGEGDVEALNESYERLESAAKEALEDVKVGGDLSYEKLSSALMMNKALKMMNSYAKKNSYLVPIKVGGEMTNIHLTIEKNENAMKNVRVSMNSEGLGSIKAIFTVKEMTVSGYVASDNADTVQVLNAHIGEFANALSSHSMSMGSIEYSMKASLEYEVNGDEEVTVNTYYNVAKAFIKTIKSSAEVK